MPFRCIVSTARNSMRSERSISMTCWYVRLNVPVITRLPSTVSATFWSTSSRTSTRYNTHLLSSGARRPIPFSPSVIHIRPSTVSVEHRPVFSKHSGMTLPIRQQLPLRSITGLRKRSSNRRNRLLRTQQMPASIRHVFPPRSGITIRSVL